MIRELFERFARKLLPMPQEPMVIEVTGLPPALAGTMNVDALAALSREAESGQMDRLFRLYAEILGGDTSIMACVWQRKAGLIGQPWQLNAPEEGGLWGKRLAKGIERQLRNTAGLRDTFKHLLDSNMWWPVVVVRKVYAPSRTPGLLYDLVRLEPIPFYRLDFTGGNVEPAGTLRLKCVDRNGRLTGETEPIRPIEHVVHRGHMLTTFPDTWGGPGKAGLLWWFFATCTRQWWARNLNKHGTPFMVGRVQPTDSKGRAALLRAFQDTSQMLGVVVSADTQLEVHQTLNAATTDSFDRFHTLCRRELSKLLTGQTMTTEGQAQGLGGTQANVQDSRLDDITGYDGAELGETFKEQIIRPWMELNGLGREYAPDLGWGAVDTSRAEVSGAILTALSGGGLRLTDQGIGQLSDIIGLQIERAPVPASPGGIAGFSANPVVPALDNVRSAREAGALIDESAADDLAAAFRGDLAPIRRLVREAPDAASLEMSLSAFYADWQPTRAARVLEEALTAHAANGLIKTAAAAN